PFMHLIFKVRRWFSRTQTELILWNQDTYPEVLVAVRMLRERSLVYRLLLWLERWGVRRMDKVIALDRAMAGILESHGGKRVTVVPNWEIDLADGQALSDPHVAKCLRRANADYRYLVLYTGNYGWGHDLTILFDYLQRHPDRRIFFFLFVGWGEQVSELLAVP